MKAVIPLLMKTRAATQTALSVIAASVVLLTASLAASVHASSLELSAEKQASLGVRTAVVESVARYPGAHYSGTAIIPPNQRLEITAPLPGLVTRLVRFHGRVKVGEVLFEMQSPALLNAQKDYLNNLSDLSAAQSERNRTQKLIKTGAVSTRQYQEAVANLKKFQQIQHQQRQALHLMGMSHPRIEALENTQQLQSSTIEITATLAGELHNLKAYAGQRLAAGDSMVSVGDFSPIVVEAPIPVALARQLSLKQTVIAQPLDETNAEPLIGEIEYLPLISDEMTQTLKVHIQFPNADQRLLPGQSVLLQFEFAATAKQPIFRIPRGAISRYDNQDVVYLKHGQRIQAIPIQIKHFSPDTLFFSTQFALPHHAELVIESTAAIKGLLDSTEGDD